MDTYFEFASLLNEPEGLQTSSGDLFVTSSEPFDIPVDTEKAGGGLSCTYCVIC